jgi:MOSC domain-containing protein YiiM
MSTIERNTTLSPIGSIVSVQVGHVAALGARQVPSAFVKRPISGRVMVERLGLVGDRQAELRVHGGPEKAVYCYPFEHYAQWLGERPSAEGLLVLGGFGENLTTLRFGADDVCIGDILRIGSVTAQDSTLESLCKRVC